jgi:hypothetical protein
MNLALNCEYPDPDKARLIEEMVKAAVERKLNMKNGSSYGTHF